MIPLSMIGISREDKDMLSKRLFPEANKILIEKLAKDFGYDPKQMEQIDYCDHPIYKFNKMMAKRKQQAERLKGIDTSEFDYKFKSFDEAKEAEPGQHVEPQYKETVEELEEKMEKVKLAYSKPCPLKSIVI